MVCHLGSTGKATEAGDERKRKPQVGLSPVIQEKKTKKAATTGSSLLSSGTLSLTSSGTLTSLTSGLSLASSSLSSKLFSSSLGGTSHAGDADTALSKLSIKDGKGSSALSHLSVGLSLGGSSKLSHFKEPAKGHSTSPKVREAKTSPRDSSEKGRSKLGKSNKKKMKLEGKIATSGARALERYAIPQPEYSLRTDEVDDVEIEIPRFIHPSRDETLIASLHKPLSDTRGLKNGLINAVSASLLCSPNFRDPRDQARLQLVVISKRVLVSDPEFVALYARRELNIRTTSNFLLALASNHPECRPFLRKYYSATIMLPSDWIEVAEIYQAFKDDHINFGSLPSALRKVMVTKFADFDKYQLAKYNKDKSGAKKKKKAGGDTATSRGGLRGRRGGLGFRGRGGGRGREVLLHAGTKRPGPQDSSSEDESYEDESYDQLYKQELGVEFDEESDTEEERQLKTFTLKQLIRKLHIVEPVEHVMSLIGKKYPLTPEEFYKSRLPGLWEEERAGKRMKLPVPETWETQVSLKGNKAETWQDLLDHKKLPFMAMLRNLRNLIKAGISMKHHNMVIRRLTDQRQVVNSKQFPFRFFSAYQVLNELEQAYEKSRRGRGAARGSGRGRGRGAANQWWIKRQEKNKAAKSTPQETPFDLNIIKRYRKALDTAVKIATVHNVQPIKGRTVIICSVDSQMMVPCDGARRGLGQSRTVAEVSLLLALMCKYSCEESELVLHDAMVARTVDVERGTILDNLARLLDSLPLVDNSDASSWDERKRREMMSGFPHWVLGEKLRDRVPIDNLIVLGFHLEPDQPTGRLILDFLRPYRRLVNPNMLYVSICAAGKNCKFNTEIKSEHENDIYISGFSDAILRFIAERGSGGQLLHVENIDTAFNLLTPTPIALESADKQSPAFTPEKPLPVSAMVPRWRTARVFISSTFRDMHGERDLLTRFVFPELRALGRHHFINVFEMDLRWGVTEEDTRNNRTLELCLQELTKCQLFVGLLGERYGWVPSQCQLPDTPEFDCVRQYKQGASVTELEMHFGALSDIPKTKGRAVFFIRDSLFEKDIPLGFKPDFVSESEEAKARLHSLKNRVRTSGHEVFDGYPCRWGGVVDNKPMVAGLEEFGQRALNMLWLAVQRLCPDEDAMLDEDTHILRLHRAFVDSRHEQFVGRKTMIKHCVNKIISTSSGIIGLVGKGGSGKSALMASVIYEYVQSKHCASGNNVFVHIVGAAPGSTCLAATLRRLCLEIKRNFGLTTHIPDDFNNLAVTFGTILKEAGDLCSPSSPLVVFVDGLYLMETAHQPCNLEWLPQPLPPNVVVMISAVEGDMCHKALVRLKADVVTVGALDMFEKAEVVRQTLAAHRKALDESAFNNQLKFLMMKKEAHSPLFLKIACEELRVFGVFEKVTSKLKSMSHTTPQLMQEVLQRLETDHGVDLVTTTLSLLICARDGLLSEELFELLAWQAALKAKKEKIQPREMVRKEFPSSAVLPPATFAYLQRSVQSFLNPLSSYSGSVCLTLAHPEIETAIRQRYLRGAAAEQEQQLHRLLAGYYMRQADPGGDGTWKGRNARAFSELPYHLSHAGCYHDLEDTLCSLLFIHAKCMLGQATQLMDDFVAKGASTKSMEKEQVKFLATPRVKEYQTFVSTNLHILSSYPALTWQQASNSTEDSLVCQELRRLRTAGLIEDDTGCMDWDNKPTSPDPCYLHLANLQQPATCVAVSPDGTYFASGGLDCLVRLYDMATGKEVRFYRGHSDAITDVCFINQSVLCSASLDKTLSLWDVEQGHRIAHLQGHTRRVNACAGDPSGKLVASASWDTTVRIWNAAKGQSICDFDLGCPVNDVAFHPEGQLIVTGSWDALIRIYDIFHKTRKAVLRGHMSSVRAVAFSHDGVHIASASLDGDVKIWSATKGVQVGNIRGHGGPINRLTFSPTGRDLITASDDHKVKVWSGELGIPLHVIGSEDDGPATAAALSPDGTTVAVGYHSSYVRVYDVGTGLLLWQAKPHTMSVRAITYTTDGNHIITGSDDCKAHVLEASHGTLVYTMEGHTQAILGITAHRKYVATTSQDCSCCLFPPVKTAKRNRIVKPLATLRGHTGPVTSCTFGPGAQKLATASRDMSVCIWDVRVCEMDPNPSPESTMTHCHADWVNACGWSSTAEFMVSVTQTKNLLQGSDFNLKVWDMKTKEEKHRLVGHTSSINTMAYKFGCVVSGSSDGQVKVWSHRGTEITTLYGHTQRVNACDVYVKCRATDGESLEKDEESGADEEEKSWAQMAEEEEDEASDKKKVNSKKQKGLNVQDVLVVSCSDDGTVRLWRPLQANTLASLTGHSDRVLAVAVDKDGHVASAGLDNSLRLWAPKLVNTMQVTGQHEAEVTCITAGPDRNVVLSTDRSGVVSIWQYNRTSGFTCVYSFKAHEKSVNAACFVNKGSTKFVTASDDMTMAVWDILHKKEGMIVRKRLEDELRAPVTSLAWAASLINTTEVFVVGASWDGCVFFWSADTKKWDKHAVCEGRVSYGPKRSYDWPLSICPEGNQLLTTTTDGNVATLVLTKDNKSNHVEVSKHMKLTVPTDQVSNPAEVKEYPDPPNWVHVAAVGRGAELYFGDSWGQLSRVSKYVAWHQLKVGQFFCQAPITSLCQPQLKE
ncbi:hypothetical protein BaRGS_00020026 [Batillaria attramentaria]|uniref:TROVE domain-containing protein n=1 Tax=Batillaria attramentaria TaxID=370345 RepID=A0ABD0KNF3_9CAEN